ncbi:hypothetical protein RHMOL_Rhmol01G0256700 [Rhododendron molle]|uniref:Uncharacterized protein n=3 Tax=Rhododendron molle TaxID=49168 RepID=A0ACC0Q581_RHOML|nr:hypothetical protein RHMOL_Rhmol01G0256700 [Rhododendron molle]KAI8573154.1 hypothetical protein RHMOL_Rhmol01G0256700 [Rhododendron molle]KAI8573155.1 hypothetical protein RHMOL_Rhmol01G0256700 [Rhododendron molle]
MGVVKKKGDSWRGEVFSCGNVCVCLRLRGASVSLQVMTRSVLGLKCLSGQNFELLLHFLTRGPKHELRFGEIFSLVRYPTPPGCCTQIEDSYVRVCLYDPN